jgi:quercetin dioxygenase-like cupin family protein
MSRRKVALASLLTLALVAAVIGIGAVALGLPGSGVTSTNLVTADFDQTVHMNSDGVKFQTKDATDVRVQRLDFAPGAYSGWHHHPGIIVVAVASGAVTLWDSDCNSETYGPGLPSGEVFAEGGDHAVQATSTNGATVYVTYVAPSADPPVFRIEDDLPADHCG